MLPLDDDDACQRARQFVSNNAQAVLDTLPTHLAQCTTALETVKAHLRAIVVVTHRGRKYIVRGINPDDVDDPSQVTVSEYSRAELLPWVTRTITDEVDLVDERSYSTRGLCDEMLSKAEDGMITYTASDLGIRCAVRGNGFYVLLDADATVAEVIDDSPPHHCIVISNMNVLATRDIIKEIDDDDPGMQELMGFVTRKMHQ
eukprot:2080652-Prymnesium_polylepis.1